MSANATETDRTSVWLFITALCVGGAAQTLVDLANNLDTDAYDVTIWTIFATTPLESELREDITVRSLTSCGQVENGSVTEVTNPAAYVLVPLRFWYVASVERPDVIQSFLFFDNVIARFAGLLSRTTTITGVRAVPKDPDTVRATVDRMTIGLSDYIVSNSRAGKELAIERGANPERVSVIRNGRNISEYRDADSAPVESELDIDDSELVVGTVGRLLERKGHFELITAWANRQESEVDARLLFVGEGKDGDAIRSHAQELECADSIEFLGTRRDVPALLSAMDVFAFPSYFEGLPGAVIEAMAAGLPIVATPVDGTEALLDNYHTGLFVPPKTTDDLEWALTRLLETPDLRGSLGDDAQQRAQAAFGIDSMVDAFETLYVDVGAA